MELRPPEECSHLAAFATRLLNSTSYNPENRTYGWTRTANSVLLFMILKYQLLRPLGAFQCT